MIRALKTYLKGFVRGKKAPKIENSYKTEMIANSLFYQNQNEDYNGFFRLLKDISSNQSNTLQNVVYKFFIISGDICAIADEDKLFGRYDFSDMPTKNILIDMSTEAINLSLHNSFYINNLRKFCEIISKERYCNFKFYLLHANTASFDLWQKTIEQLGINQPNLKFVGIDFYLSRFYIDLQKNNLIDILQQRLNYFDNEKKQKHYLCLNHRPRWQRYAVTLNLLKNGYLEKGYVSFAGEEKGRIDAPTVENLEQISKAIKELTEGNELLKHLPMLNNIAPLIVDRDPETIQNELWGKEKTGHINQPLGIQKESSEFNADFLSCYFEIVTETYFTNDTCSYITEKTLRPILCMRPFVVVGTPFSLKKLKQYGFKTFSPLIDESYDEVVDPVTRMDLILQEINRICSLTLNEIHQLYEKMIPILKFNLLHFIKSGDDIARKVLEDKLLQIHQ